MPNVNIVIQPVNILAKVENSTVQFTASGSLAGTVLSANPVVYLWQTAPKNNPNSFSTAQTPNTASYYDVQAIAALDGQTYRVRLSAAGVDAAVFSNVVTLGIRTSAESPYDKFETNTFESGRNRFRRLKVLGYVG